MVVFAFSDASTFIDNIVFRWLKTNVKNDTLLNHMLMTHDVVWILRSTVILSLGRTELNWPLVSCFRLKI